MGLLKSFTTGEKYTIVESYFNVKHCQKIIIFGANVNVIVEFLQIIMEFICWCMEVISPGLLS